MFIKKVTIYYFVLCLSSTIAFGDKTENLILQSEDGQKIFRKKLRRLCNFTSAKFAQTHTASEWKNLKTINKFRLEIYNICPKITLMLKDKWVEPLFALAIVYAKDSEQYPE